MKFKLLLIISLALCSETYAQDISKSFDEVKEVRLSNVGVIKNNNVVKGYYSFYEYDKASKKTRIFKLNLLDENMNILGQKDIEGPKDWELISGGFDGAFFCFKFYDQKEKSFEMRVYDQQANEVNNSSIKVNYGLTGMKYQQFTTMTSPELHVAQAGFVNYTFNDDNDSFVVNYIDGKSKKSWQQAYEPDGKSKIMWPDFLVANKDVVLTMSTRIEKGMFSAKAHHSLLANSILNGNQVFDLSMEIGENYIIPLDAVFEDGKFLVVGLNYKSTKTYSSSPDGLAFLEVDKTGKLLKSTFTTIEESLGKYLPIVDHKLSDGYYMYIHDIVRTKNNTNLVIAEKFKKAVSAGGAALSMIGGGSGPIKLQLENMIVIEYDIAGKVIQAQQVPRAQSSTIPFPSYVGFLPTYLLGVIANSEGQMGYEFELNNDDYSDITFSFTEHDALGGNSKKTDNFGQIKYKDGKITVDKTAIKNDKATRSFMLPAKPGHVLQVNYFKKEKRLSMDLIKLNN